MKNFVVFGSRKTNRKYSRLRGDTPIQVSYVGMRFVKGMVFKQFSLG